MKMTISESGKEPQGGGGGPELGGGEAPDGRFACLAGDGLPAASVHGARGAAHDGEVVDAGLEGHAAIEGENHCVGEHCALGLEVSADTADVTEYFGTLVTLQDGVFVTEDAGDRGEVVQLLAIDGKAVNLAVTLAHLEGRQAQFVSVGHIIS